MVTCIKCGCTEFIIEKDVIVGWRLIADKVTCCDCGNVVYMNEREEED